MADRVTIWDKNVLLFGPAECPKVFSKIPVSGINYLSTQERIGYGILSHISSSAPIGSIVVSREIYRDGDVSREHITTKTEEELEEEFQETKPEELKESENLLQQAASDLGLSWPCSLIDFSKALITLSQNINTLDDAKKVISCNTVISLALMSVSKDSLYDHIKPSLHAADVKIDSK